MCLHIISKSWRLTDCHICLFVFLSLDLNENSDFKAEVGEANVKHDITSVNEAERVLTTAATAAPLPDTVGMEGVVRESTLSKSDSGASSDAGKWTICVREGGGLQGVRLSEQGQF